MHIVQPVAALALGLIFCIGGCAPIPYPALTSTEQRPTPLAEPLGAELSIAFATFPHEGSATECVIRELQALQPPLRVTDSVLLRDKLRGLKLPDQGPPPNLDEMLADAEVQRAIGDHKIAYAIDLTEFSDRGGGCDFNLGVASGRHVKKTIIARVFDLESRQYLGEIVVTSSGQFMGLGFSICTSAQGPGAITIGAILIPITYACDRMAEELHIYFTTGR